LKLIFLFVLLSLSSNALDYIQKSHDLKLSNKHYWKLLLHMKNGKSEIDDKRFFLAKDGNINAKLEMDATLNALLHENVFDDNATACRFPARTSWLVKELKIKHLPHVRCSKYQETLTKLDPTSATIVFPSAHINSPASMFGHTFLRINSSYHSKLLSYAINYAANVDESKTNGFLFAIHGLTGGYRGVYSMLPYYEKLKEYRDSEQRDIWEYDLNLTQIEVIRMFQHIWELNGIYSDYYFFTENCSYNLLWLLEIARKGVDLRSYFTYHVSPLETIHAMKDEVLLIKEHYRDSKRSILLKYEEVIDDRYITYVKKILSKNLNSEKVLYDKHIPIQQKRYLFEAAIDLLEYYYMQAKITKKEYLSLFHQLTTARAKLGRGDSLSNVRPESPLNAHRQARVTLGFNSENSKSKLLIGIRPVYHDLYDNAKGLLRGTQIEFLNTLLRIDNKSINIEKFTLLSISSISQISEFIKPFSWRTHFQWDRNYINNQLNFNIDIGVGTSWGNEFGYTYLLGDVYGYIEENVVGAFGVSAGFIIDKSRYFKTNVELQKRWYTNGFEQSLINVAQSYSMTSNTQLKFEYLYRKSDFQESVNNSYRIIFNYYF